MRIDISGDSFDRRNRYTRVLLQQGRPLIDRDWNEHTEIISYQIQNLTMAIYGPHGGPGGGRCGFIPRIAEGEIYFQPGIYSIDGILLSCDEEQTYFNQRYFKPPAFDAGRSYLIYIEAVEREVTSAEQVALLDEALPGVDVAARGQLISRLIHIDWVEDKLSGRTMKSVVETCNMLMAKIKQEQQIPKVSFLELFSGQEKMLRELAAHESNRLFRIEYNGNNEWKLSFDNAFARFKVIEHNGSRMLLSQGAIGMGSSFRSIR